MSIKNFINRFFLILVIITVSLNFLSAQTGPGGIGNSSGANSQPQNILWLDASSLAYSDGNDLVTWTDLSGNGNNLSQSNASYTPVFQDDASNINGHPRAEFSKSNNRIVINPFNDMAVSGITTFFVYKTTDSGDGLLSYATTSNNNEFLLFSNNSFTTYLSSSNNNSGVALNSGNWQFVSHKWQSSDGALKINQNGDQQYSTIFQNGHSIQNAGSLAIGGEQDAVDGSYDAGQAFQGEIAEIIMYKSSINSAQRIIVENYLSAKYAINFTTASIDKYKGNDAGYVYNIAGIGKESDGSQSLSSSAGFYIQMRNSSFANGEYVMFAHNDSTNSSSTIITDVTVTTCGAEAAWNRNWYIEKTSSDGIDIKLIFDFKEALSDGQYPDNVSNYVLLYRSGTSGNYTKVTVAGQGILDADQVYFDIDDANLVDGYYTIGTDNESESPIEGKAGKTWYALASGDWDNWEYWTLDPSGALPNNPDHLTPINSDKVIIQTGKTITLASNSKTVSSITIDGILDIGSTSGHNFTIINGSGRIKLKSDNFPSGSATDFVTAGQGEGTVVWQGTSYNLSSAHTFYNMEIELDNATDIVTLLSNYTINGSLFINKGILQINDNSSTTDLDISISGDLTIESNGQIATGTADARHQLDLYGDFTNNGTAKFTNRAVADYANEATNGIVDLNFLSDNTNQTILCNGITNFYRIEIDKGTDDTYILDITATNSSYFNLYGYASQGHPNLPQLVTNTNALGLLKGTVRINSNVSIPVLNRTSNYNISEAARIWIDGGTVQKNSGVAIVPYGIIQITSGLLESKISSGITLRANGLIKVEGGTINTNQIRTSVLGTGHVGGYVQSGGTVNLVDANHSNKSYYHFSLTYSGNVFNMSGGTLHIYDANDDDENSGGIFIASDPVNVNVTGGTVIAEISAAVADTFKITSKAPFWNLILRNTNDATSIFKLDSGSNINGSSDADIVAQDLVIYNDFTIEDNCFLDHNGKDITIGAGFTIEENTQQHGNNYGLLYDVAKPNILTFNGSVADTFYIAYNSDDNYELYLWNLTINKTNNSEIVLKAGLNKEPDNVSSAYYNRIVNVQGTIDVINGTLNQGKQSIRLYANVYVRANGILGVYEPGVTDLTAYIMLKDDVAGSTDLYTEKGAEMGNFKLNPSDGKVVGIMSDVHIKRIGYHNGSMNTRSYNLKVDYLHRNATTNNFANNNGASDRMIYSDANASDGGLSIMITGNGTYCFPLGTTADASIRYTWADVTISNFADTGYITIRPVDDTLKTTDLTGGEILSYYWRVGYSDFSTLPTVKYNFKYEDHDVGDESLFYPGKVLDIDPYTRSYEQMANVDISTNTITFDNTGGTSGNTGNGFTLEKANYSAGATNRFTGAPTIYYSRFLGNAANTTWTNSNNWTLAPNDIDGNTTVDSYEKHDSRQPAAGNYPQAGDIAVVGWVPYGDPNYTDGYPHGIEVNSTVDFAELVFNQMLDANNGNPTARKYAYNFQFRPTICINPGGTLIGTIISGEGLFWCRSTGGNQVDPDFSPIDIGDFIKQDSSYLIYESTSNAFVYDNIPSQVPNLMISGNGWGSVDRDFEISTDVEIEQDFELLGDINLVLSSGTNGNFIVKNDMKIFRNNANGNDSEGDGEIAFPNDASKSIEIYGDLKLINEHAKISVRSPNTTVFIHSLTIHGNIYQDNTSGGGVQLYTASDEDYIKLILKGEGTNTYSVNSGAIANFYSIQIDKGNDQTSSFSFDSDFNLNGPTSGISVTKSFDLQNGKAIINNSDITVNLTTGDDDFQIPPTSCLQLTQGTAYANGNSGILLDGKLLINGGTLDMSGGDNYIQYSASGNATIEISSGSLVVGSQVRRGTSSTEGILIYNQSGGTVEIGKNAAGTAKRGIFEILNTGSSFTLSGGTFSLANDYRTNPTIQSFYFNPENVSFSNNTPIKIGNLNTVSAEANFTIYAGKTINNLIIDNSSSNNPYLKAEVVAVSIQDSLAIQNGAEFDANGLDLNIYGDFTNLGTFTANQNTTYLKGNSDQYITGNTSFYNLTNQNINDTVKLVINTTDINIDNVFSLENNTIINDNGNDIKVYGNIANSGIHVHGNSGDGISLLGTSAQEITGSGVFGMLTINNANGISVPVGNTLTINNYLKMNNGILNIGGNLLILNKNCQIIEANAFGSNNMIETNISFTDNGVKKYFPSGALNFTYPIGSGGKYTPIIISITQNSNDTYLIAKSSDEIHPSIQNDSENPDPEITDKDNVLQYYWTLTAQDFTDLSGTIEMYYDESDVSVTSPYDVFDYITAKLLNDGTGQWYKFDDVSKFDESNKKLIFDFNADNDKGITGDYIAGVDGSTFNGAIPDQVPLYVSNGTGARLDWHNAATWVHDAGLPDYPRGARVKILVGDTVYTNSNYLSTYTTEILGELDVNTTFGNRLGNVTGNGIIYSEIGTLPAGYYEVFLSDTGGTLEFGGNSDYSILSNIWQVNNIIFSGTGVRELPNLDLQILGNLEISGDDATLQIINEFDRKTYISRTITFNNGSFDAGTSSDAIIEFNGTYGRQTINGTNSFTGSNAFNYMIMNNSAGLLLAKPVDLEQNLTFTNGIIYTDNTNILKLTNTSESIISGAGSNKFVDGPVSKNILSTGNFNFPIGDDSRFGSASVLSSSVNGYWIAEYLNHNPNNEGYDPTVYNSPLQSVSSSEYWRIEAPTSASAIVKIRWDSHSGLPTDATNRNDLRIAKWTDLSTDAWTELDASNTISGDQNNGTVVQTNTSSFNEFGTGNFFTLSTIYTPTSLTWDGSESIVWNDADNWTPAKIPSAVDDITIPSSGVTNEPTIDISATCNVLDLQNGRTLTINAGKSFTVYGDFTLNGTLVLETPTGNGPSASFIDNGTISGTGSMTAKRLFSGGKFHYLSSPIQAGGNANSNLFTTSHPDGNFNANFYYYNESYDIDNEPTTAPAGAYSNLKYGDDCWVYAHNDDDGAVPINLDVNTGYAFYTTVDQTISFIGTPNTGDMSISNLTFSPNDVISESYPNTYDGWELVANPYPSAIDWDVIKTDLTNLDEGIYVWDGAQYASYVNGVQGGSGNLSNEIAPMQAFFVHTNADNAGFTLNNSARIHSSSNYLKKKSKNQNNSKENYIRLKLAGNGYNDYSAIYFTSKASNNFDGNLETYKMFSPDYVIGIPHLFSILENEQTPMAINALPEIELKEKTVPLGIKINTSGNYTISIDEFNFDNSKVYLIDKQENTEICLNDENLYSFDFTAGDDRNRFELKFVKNTNPMLNIELFDLEANEDDVLNLKLFDNTFIDYDKDDYITYSARLSNNNQLPSWMTFDNLNITFSGTPDNNDVGAYDIELKATDRFGAFGTTIFTLNILNINDIPVLNNQIPDMTTNLGDYYSYNIPVNTFMDVDFGDELVLSAKLVDGSDLPNWLIFDPVYNTFSGYSNNKGDIYIKVTATDKSGAEISDNFKLSVLEASGLNENSDRILVYPNPTDGKFNIVNFNGNIIITDINGKVIIKRETVNDIEKFDISNYPTGSYFIRVISDEKTKEQIILKK